MCLYVSVPIGTTAVFVANPSNLETILKIWPYVVYPPEARPDAASSFSCSVCGSCGSCSKLR